MLKILLIFFQLYFSTGSYLDFPPYEISIGDPTQNPCTSSDCVSMEDINSALDFIFTNSNSSRQNFQLFVTSNSQNNTIISQSIVLTNVTLNFR